MTIHHTKNKGDLACAKVCMNLTEKGYNVFIPAFTQHLRYDLIIEKDNVLLKIQVKHSSDEEGVVICQPNTSWANQHGSFKSPYVEGDFDYYGIYLPLIDKCIYPAFKFKGRCIRTTKPANVNDKGYLWWEDFIELTVNADPHFDVDQIARGNANIGGKGIERPERRRVNRPSKEELTTLIWAKPTLHIARELGVSDVAVAKWVKFYGLSKPPRGYWQKVLANKLA